MFLSVKKFFLGLSLGWGENLKTLRVISNNVILPDKITTAWGRPHRTHNRLWRCYRKRFLVWWVPTINAPSTSKQWKLDFFNDPSATKKHKNYKNHYWWKNAWMQFPFWPNKNRSGCKPKTPHWFSGHIWDTKWWFGHFGYNTGCGRGLLIHRVIARLLSDITPP